LRYYARVGYNGMVMDFDPRVIFIVLQLIYLEGILSIDNAAVLGAMVSHLPRHEPISWPSPLRFLQKPVHRLLGGQRLAALKVGLLGAYLGRGLMLFIATWVIQNRWLLLLGGLYLIKLAADHLGEERHRADVPGYAAQKPERGFWSVVVAVELADLAFSLDNVVAAVALSRELWVVYTGVGLGIVTMRFAAGIFVFLIERYPVLEAAAYLLVLYIGAGLVAEEFWHFRLNEVQRFAGSFSIIAFTLLYGRSVVLQSIGRRLRWLRRVLWFVNQVFVYALRPAAWLFTGIHMLIRAIVSFFFLKRKTTEAERVTSK
jgi:tellurite resistance protein TerC